MLSDSRQTVLFMSYMKIQSPSLVVDRNFVLGGFLVEFFCDVREKKKVYESSNCLGFRKRSEE